MALSALPDMLRLEEVLGVVRMGRSTWYKGMAEGRFPRPVRISRRIALWPRVQIEQLVSSATSGPIEISENGGMHPNSPQ
jgi:prophage regulatory protein